jgi:hypothetical protein
MVALNVTFTAAYAIPATASAATAVPSPTISFLRN